MTPLALRAPKAMILAAGLGTRLRPFTDQHPKALAMLAGKTLLERTLERLREFGVREVIVNVHHFAEQVEEFLGAHGNFGMRVELSRESELLDTGGGLKQAANFFLRDGDGGPFILHNVDVLSSIDLGAMLAAHNQRGALATLALRKASGSRRLLFSRHGGDESLQLCGRRTGEAAPEIVRPAEDFQELGFTGIHVISPRIFELWNRGPLRDERCFPIIPAYLQLAAAGERIAGFRTEGCYWRDLGTAQSLAEAAGDLQAGKL